MGGSPNLCNVVLPIQAMEWSVFSKVPSISKIQALYKFSHRFQEIREIFECVPHTSLFLLYMQLRGKIKDAVLI